MVVITRVNSVEMIVIIHSSDHLNNQDFPNLGRNRVIIDLFLHRAESTQTFISIAVTPPSAHERLLFFSFICACEMGISLG